MIYQGTNLCTQNFRGFPAHDFLFRATFFNFDNCEENESQNTCKRCKEGYILSKDQRKCSPQSAMMDENCLIFSSYECSECEPGFYFNRNNYAKEILQYSAEDSTDNYLIDIEVMFNNRQQLPLKTCLPVKDQFCTKF